MTTLAVFMKKHYAVVDQILAHYGTEGNQPERDTQLYTNWKSALTYMFDNFNDVPSLRKFIAEVLPITRHSVATTTLCRIIDSWEDTTNVATLGEAIHTVKPKNPKTEALAKVIEGRLKFLTEGKPQTSSKTPTSSKSQTSSKPTTGGPKFAPAPTFASAARMQPPPYTVVRPKYTGAAFVEPVEEEEEEYPSYESEQGPGYQGPGYQGPGYQAPGYQAPGYQAPGYQAPGYQAPGYQAPQGFGGGHQAAKGFGGGHQVAKAFGGGHQVARAYGGGFQAMSPSEMYQMADKAASKQLANAYDSLVSYHDHSRDMIVGHMQEKFDELAERFIANEVTAKTALETATKNSAAISETNANVSKVSEDVKTINATQATAAETNAKLANQSEMLLQLMAESTARITANELKIKEANERSEHAMNVAGNADNAAAQAQRVSMSVQAKVRLAPPSGLTPAQHAKKVKQALELKAKLAVINAEIEDPDDLDDVHAGQVHGRNERPDTYMGVSGNTADRADPPAPPAAPLKMANVGRGRGAGRGAGK